MENVISITEYKRKKRIESELAYGRTPLYVSHATGKITGDGSKESDFGDRLSRIRANVAKIDRLMADLKNLKGRSNEY